MQGTFIPLPPPPLLPIHVLNANETDGDLHYLANGPKPTPTAQNTSTTSAVAPAGKAPSQPQIQRPTVPSRQVPTATARGAAVPKPTRRRQHILTTTRSICRPTLRHRCLLSRRRLDGSTGRGARRRRLSGVIALRGRMAICLLGHMPQHFAAVIPCRISVIWRSFTSLVFLFNAMHPVAMAMAMAMRECECESELNANECTYYLRVYIIVTNSSKPSPFLPRPSSPGDIDAVFACFALMHAR